MSLKSSLITTPTTLSLTKLVLFVWQNSPRTVNQRQAAQAAALADRMSRPEVKHINCESDVTTVEGAGLAIADWPSTFGLRPLGDRRSSSLGPSTVVTSNTWSACFTSSLAPSVCAASYLCGLSGSLLWASSAKQCTNQHFFACIAAVFTAAIE